MRCRVGSEDNRNEMRGAPMKSSARLENGTIVIESVATFGARELKMKDRWTLASGGRTLTFVQWHQFASEPPGEDTVVYEKQPDTAWEPYRPKMSQERYRNIQVLKDIPGPQIVPIMMRFTGALGVDCSHCHAGNQFEKDDKPAKAVARRMILMARQINENHFRETNLVSCWTCHRGKSKPEPMPR